MARNTPTSSACERLLTASSSTASISRRPFPAAPLALHTRCVHRTRLVGGFDAGTIYCRRSRSVSGRGTSWARLGSTWSAAARVFPAIEKLSSTLTALDAGHCRGSSAPPRAWSPKLCICTTGHVRASEQIRNQRCWHPFRDKTKKLDALYLDDVRQSQVRPGAS